MVFQYYNCILCKRTYDVNINKLINNQFTKQTYLGIYDLRQVNE